MSDSSRFIGRWWGVAVGLLCGTSVFMLCADLTGDRSRLLLTALSILLGVASLQVSSIARLPLPNGDWKRANVHAERLKDCLLRYALLLLLYVTAVVLLVCAEIWPSVGRVAFAYAVGALVGSVGLPISIARLQLAVLDQRIAERRRESAQELRPANRHTSSSSSAPGPCRGE